MIKKKDRHIYHVSYVCFNIYVLFLFKIENIFRKGKTNQKMLKDVVFIIYIV